MCINGKIERKRERERGRESVRERSRDDVTKSQRIQESAKAHRNSKDTKQPKKRNDVIKNGQKECAKKGNFPNAVKEKGQQEGGREREKQK